MELDLEKSRANNTCDVDDEAPYTDGDQRGRDEKLGEVIYEKS